MTEADGQSRACRCSAEPGSKFTLQQRLKSPWAPHNPSEWIPLAFPSQTWFFIAQSPLGMSERLRRGDVKRAHGLPCQEAHLCHHWSLVGNGQEERAPLPGPGGPYRRRMLVDIGAVRQVDEDGVHVLDVCDDDSQVGQGRQRPGLVLILGGQRDLG